jgi:hypothetical protein
LLPVPQRRYLRFMARRAEAIADPGSSQEVSGAVCREPERDRVR